MQETRWPGILAIVVTSFLWGTTGTAATFAGGVSPLAIGAAALGIGGLLQAVIAIPSLRRSTASLSRNATVVAIGAVSVGIYPLAFYSSMHLAGVAVGSVISLASAPLFSGLLQRFVDRRPLTRAWSAAALIGIAGSVLLSVADFRGGTASATGMIPGIVLGLLAGATYATYSWAVGRLLGRGLPRAAAMGAVFGVGGLLLMPVLFFTGAPILASQQNFLVAAYMALVPMFLGYLLFGYGLTRVTAATATTITIIEPAVASLLAVWVVGERLSALGWVGISLFAVVLILLGVPPRRRGKLG